MHRIALLAPALAILSLSVVASRPTQTTSPAPAVVSPVTIPFELVTRHIMIPVKINNSRPLSFVLDTGDKFGIVDTARAKELGLNLAGQIKVGGAGSETMDGSFVQGANWMLPGLAGFSQPVVLAIPLDKLATRFGHDFDGIIGSDFIKQFVIEVDYQARVIRIHNKETFSYTGQGESVAMELDRQGHPVIEAEVTPVGGQPIKHKFVLDIGAGGALTLHSPFVSQHNLLRPDLKTIRAIGAGGTGGRTNGRVGRVAALKIGKFQIASPLTLFSEDKSGAFAGTTLAGNIGQQVASKFKLFLDYDHGRIIFEPAASFRQPFDRAFAGIAISAENQNYTTFRIIEVLENSPASEVGLQENDLILSLDDKPASQLTLTRLGEMFERPVAYKLTVRRGDQTLKVTLKPRQLV
jgi:Aspartyl protease/PDZ domain